MCGHYFVQHGLIQVCIFYRFFWETLSAVFTLCQIRYSLHKLYNICMIIIYIVDVRYSVFLFSLISNKRYRVKNIWIQTHLKLAFNKKHASVEQAFDFLKFKNSIDKEKYETFTNWKIKIGCEQRSAVDRQILLWVQRVDRQILQVDRRILRVDRGVLRMDKQTTRQVLRVEKTKLRVDKRVLRKDKRVLRVVKRVLWVTRQVFQVLRVTRRVWR